MGTSLHLPSEEWRKIENAQKKYTFNANTHSKPIKPI